MEIFLVLVIVWFSAGFYSGQVAHQKGYSGAAWAIGGLLFGFIALIAAAGLPDRKLRQYIRLIGEKQNAIEPDSGGDQWVKQPSDWDDAQKEVNKINKKYDNF